MAAVAAETDPDAWIAGLEAATDVPAPDDVQSEARAVLERVDLTVSSALQHLDLNALADRGSPAPPPPAAKKPSAAGRRWKSSDPDRVFSDRAVKEYIDVDAFMRERRAAREGGRDRKEAPPLQLTSRGSMPRWAARSLAVHGGDARKEVRSIKAISREILERIDDDTYKRDLDRHTTNLIDQVKDDAARPRLRRSKYDDRADRPSLRAVHRAGKFR